MDHPNLAVLRRLTARKNPDCLQILDALKYVVDQNNLEVTVCCAIELSLKNISSATPIELLHYITTILPDVPNKAERIEIIFMIPKVFYVCDALKGNIAHAISRIILETDSQVYFEEKRKYAQLLFSVAGAPSTPGINVNIFEEDRLNILEYIEKYLNPVLKYLEFNLSHDVYAMMATTVSPANFPRFWRILMSSKNYNYHGLIASLTKRVYNRTLSIVNALKFMKQKNYRLNEGRTKETLKQVIINAFVLALLRIASIYELEDIHIFFKSELARLGGVSGVKIWDIAKQHIKELQTINVSPRNTSKTLEILVRQAALNTQNKYPVNKNQFLKKVLDLEPFTEEMTADERRMYYALLAVSSSPKNEVNIVEKSVDLFRKLARRLLELIPEHQQDDVNFPFNEFENVAFAIYNLFDINVRQQKVLYELDESWRKKLLYILDMHAITAHNLRHLERAETNPAVKNRMKRDVILLMNVEQLLVSFFGGPSRITDGFHVALRYHISHTAFKYQKFVNSFNTETIITMTLNPQFPPDDRFDTEDQIGHSWYIAEVDKSWPKRLAKYNALLNAEDSDDNNNSVNENEEMEQGEDDNAEDNDQEMETQRILAMLLAVPYEEQRRVLEIVERERNGPPLSPIPPGHARNRRRVPQEPRTARNTNNSAVPRVPTGYAIRRNSGDQGVAANPARARIARTQRNALPYEEQRRVLEIVERERNGPPLPPIPPGHARIRRRNPQEPRTARNTNNSAVPRVPTGYAIRQNSGAQGVVANPARARTARTLSLEEIVTMYVKARQNTGQTPWDDLQQLEVTPAMYKQQLRDYGNPDALRPWKVRE